MKIMEFKIERIRGFVYLGLLVIDGNEIQEAVISLLPKGHKCYCGLKIHLISQSVPRKTKIRIKVFYLPTDAQQSCFKRILKFTLKQLLHVSVQSPSSGSLLFKLAKVIVIKIIS